MLVFELGGHRYFEQNIPLLSLSLLRATPDPRKPCESHTTKRGQPQSEHRTGCLDRALPGTDPASMKQVAAIRALTRSLSTSAPRLVVHHGHMVELHHAEDAIVLVDELPARIAALTHPGRYAASPGELETRAAMVAAFYENVTLAITFLRESADDDQNHRKPPTGADSNPENAADVRQTVAALARRWSGALDGRYADLYYARYDHDFTRQVDDREETLAAARQDVLSAWAARHR
jgi:hypothetical protein